MGCGTSTSTKVDTSSSHSNANKELNQNNDYGSIKKVSTKKLTSPQRTSVGKSFKIGDRVHVRGYVGTVKFVGPTGLGGSREEWLGIELDRDHEQGNEGSFQGVQFFTCKPKHGMFAKPSAVRFHDEDLDSINNTWCDVSPQTLIFIQTRIRRFLARLRLRKLQARSGIEREIDAHVFRTPKEETTSVNRLSEYLTAPWTDERKKALAIYRWMTLNIAYDVEGFFGKKSKKSCDADSVLQSRSCVCAGFANLFEALCKAANLEAKTVEGYAKGYGYDPKQTFLNGKSNHAWNLLKVNRKWYICEVTWGAGSIGDDMLFTREPNINYFLMDPEYAITDHFPLDTADQLLEEPIKKGDFEKLVVPSTDFVSMGIEVVSHPFCLNQTDEDRAEIQFYAPLRTVLMGHLKYGASGEKVGPRNMVQIHPCGINQVKVTAQFPEPGEYQLDISVLVEGKWKFGIRYIFITSKGIGQNKGGFPLVSSEFHPSGFELESPPENITTDNGKATISLRCYNNRYSGVSGSLVKLTGKSEELKQEHCLCFGLKQENGFYLKVHFPESGEYKLNVFAKKLESGKSVWLCTYFINSSEGVRPLPGFPHLSDKFSAWGLELVDAMQNIFSEDGRVSIRLKTPSDVNVTSYLKLFESETNLGNHLCFVQRSGDESKIFVHTPNSDLYKLVVMGTREHGDKQEFLCSYKIKSNCGVGENAGFVRTSSSFKELGLEIQDQVENIFTKDGRLRVEVTVKSQSKLSLLARLNQNKKDLDHQLCFVEENEESRTIHAHTPAPGFYKLNVFARTNFDSKWEFVFSFFVQSGGAVKHPGFVQLSDDFVAWGLELESSCESVVAKNRKAVIQISNPQQVNMKAWLYDEEKRQQPNACVTVGDSEQSNKTAITCDLPGEGKYQLNIFGSKRDSQGNQKFLMKHKIIY